MKVENYELEFLTPCFCAGADQGKPELRASAVRGQLRWWFRALGGSREEESRVFGGTNIGKNKPPVASKVVVRAKLLSDVSDWMKPEFKVTDTQAYVWYYAKVSGLDPDAPKYEKDKGGPRWQNDAYFAPGAKWSLQIVYRASLGVLQDKFNQALKCFLTLGAIGLRVTRGLGGFVCKQQGFGEEVKSILQSGGFALEEKPCSPERFYEQVGSYVKGTRAKYGWKNNTTGQTPSPMGISGPRQMSAVYFRLVKKPDGQYALVVFSAPYARVLGEASREEVVVGCNPSALVPYSPRPRR